MIVCVCWRIWKFLWVMLRLKLLMILFAKSFCLREISKTKSKWNIFALSIRNMLIVCLRLRCCVIKVRVWWVSFELLCCWIFLVIFDFACCSTLSRRCKRLTLWFLRWIFWLICVWLRILFKMKCIDFYLLILMVNLFCFWKCVKRCAIALFIFFCVSEL